MTLTLYKVTTQECIIFEANFSDMAHKALELGNEETGEMPRELKMAHSKLYQ